MENQNSIVASFTAKATLERYCSDEINVATASDDELVDYLYSAFLERDDVHGPVRVCGGKEYFFDTDEIYCSRPARITQMELFVADRLKWNCFNGVVWRHAAATYFQEGMTLKECLLYYLNADCSEPRPANYSFIERFAQRIEVSCERDCNNKNKKTFDRVRVFVFLGYKEKFPDWESLKDGVKTHFYDIFDLVLGKISTNKSYVKYGVPIGFLKVSDWVLRRNYSLEMIFELRDLES